jgi:RNA polymerase sigma-70 factor (ECF subfamily)
MSITISETKPDTMKGTRAHEFEETFREHYQLVYRTARVITGSRADAEDVLQTIFLRLLQRAAPPDLRKNPKGYFYRAAVNLSLNTIRSRKRQPLTANADLAAALPPVDNPLFDETLLKHMRDAIATLSPRTAETIILRYVHDYSEVEIAKLLGRSRGTVAVTLFRARARLRKLLKASGEKI